MKLMLKNVRMAFAALFEAKTVNGEGEPAFSAAFIFEPGHPAEKMLRDAYEAVGKEKWGAKWPTVKKAMEGTGKLLIQDGDLKEKYDGYPGNLFVNARSKTRPLAIDEGRNPVTERDGKLYAGCYVNASVELWAQDNQYGKRINASLRGVQFARDGEPFAGGGAADASEFDEVDTDSDSLV
jgi:hypothetical protein